MPLRFLLSLVLIFFIGCSTTPVKYDKPVKVDDYKHFVRLSEEQDNPVSKKTFSQKVKEAFTTKPKVDNIEVEETEVTVKKTTPPKRRINVSKKTTLPKRRIRQTNTNSVDSSPGELMPMAPREEAANDFIKTVLLYFIYLQALIIAIFAFVILRRQKRAKKVGELNL